MSRTPGSLSDVEIAQIVDELAPLVVGQPVGKVREREDATLEVELGRARLVLSAHPRASRLHLAAERERDPGSPPAAGRPATAFAMLARKRLSGLRVTTLAVTPGERVVTLDHGPGRDRLVAELTGPHANVFLVDGEGKIVASLRPTGSTTRPLRPGDAYAPPPPAPATARWRGGRRFGESPGVAGRVAAHYDAALRQASEEALREQVGAALRRDLDRLQRRRRALDGDLARIDEAAQFRKYGDLLLAHLREVRAPGSPWVTLPDDFEDGAPLTIALDAALDARTNAARYYRQFKRLTGGRRRAEERRAATAASIAAREETLARLPAMPLDELARLAPKTPAPRARRAAPAERLPYREFRSLAGDLIRVGRTAADNDALTFRFARGGDLWLHTRDAPGAHVVVPRPPPAGVSEATLLDAATLAAHFSPLRDEPQVDITYTHVKNVRHPRNAPPGMVFLSEARTLRLRIEPERLARLLGEDEP